MHRLRKDLRKNGITEIYIMLLLMFIVLVLESAVSAQKKASGLDRSRTVTVQVTPQGDATMVALNKEKLKEEIQQIKNQNELDLFRWLRTNAAVLLSTLAVVVGGLLGLWRWLVDRRSERKKRDEERFQAAVTGFGNDKEDAKIAAAITLRTFLRPGYEQFYVQSFDLAVANLRTSHPSRPLSQALTVAFTQAFPLARDWIKQGSPSSRLQRIKERLQRTFQVEKPFKPQSLDASYIQLDKAFLWKADLRQVFMPWSSLRETDLTEANLTEASLWGGDPGGDLYKVKLRKAILRGADLGAANLSEADLSDADLTGAKLWANLTKAKLWGADLTEAKLCGSTGYAANLSEANLTKAKLYRADLRNVDLTKAELYGADLRCFNLNEAVLHGAKYNTKVMQGKDEQGNPIAIEKTQWPSDFNFGKLKDAGAICVDC